jgi:hypothetical protein
MRINRIGLIAIIASLTTVSCGEDSPLGDTVATLAKECGIDVDCETGILEGNASISGVASVRSSARS